MFLGLLGTALLLSAGAEPIWHRDYGQARALARLSGRPLFVVFRCEH